MAQTSFDSWERQCVRGTVGKPWWPRVATLLALDVNTGEIHNDLNHGSRDEIISQDEINATTDDPQFRQILESARAILPQIMAGRMQRLSAEAFKTLSTFARLKGAAIKDEVRLRAALSVLEAVKALGKESPQAGATARATAELVIRIERSERDTGDEAGRTITLPLRLEDGPDARGILPRSDGQPAAPD